MGDRLKELKERSLKRKELLAKALGVEGPDGLKEVLNIKEDAAAKRKSQGDSGAVSTKKTKTDDSKDEKVKESNDKKSNTSSENGVDQEDEFYKDSSTFLKGTQSANPHNDYCQNFVDTGERPQNFIRDTGLANRFEEYPKLRELIRLKDELISTTNTPPMYLKCDLQEFDLSEIGCKFDVMLIEPPLEEYQRSGAVYDKYWSWDEIENLNIHAVAAQRSFLWIWCGNADGLERGRKCLKKWGFRRCEDICWIKTNIKNPLEKRALDPSAVLQRTKEHCLMGIKGTVKRSTDGDFIHANVDIDLIIDEETEYGSKSKPVEIFHIMEHFCLGKRRLHVFGRDDTIRAGWLTVGPELTSSNFDANVYSGYFNKNPNDFLTGCSEEIERLRPKSPTPKNKGQGGSSDGRGGGRGGSGSRGGSGNRGSGSGNRGGQQGRGGSFSRGGHSFSGSRGGSFSRGGRSRGGFKGRGGDR